MLRKISWLIIIAALLAIAGELLSLQLPTLRWPFNVAREFGPILPEDYRWILGFFPNNDLTQPFVPVFGYLFSIFALGGGLALAYLTRKPFTPITLRRIQRFKSIRRGYISLWVLIGLVALASLDQLLVGNKPLILNYQGSYYFPAFQRVSYDGSKFGLDGDAALTTPNYRKLKQHFAAQNQGNWLIMPPLQFAPTADRTTLQTEELETRADGKVYQRNHSAPFSGIAARLYDPEQPERMHSRVRMRNGLRDGEITGWSRKGNRVYTANYSKGKLISENFTGEADSHSQFHELSSSLPLRKVLSNPAPPLPRNGHWLGTDSNGNDVLAYLYGGLQVNIKAALIYIPFVYAIGVSVGLLMGFFGGFFDLIVQRLIEIFSNIPFLFVLIIISSSIPDQFKSLGPILLILILFGWMNMTYLMRTAALKEKARDYVASSRVIGCSTATILLRHILPNTVAILVTLVPFSISGLIIALTSLDYLGFGLPPQYATWGRLLQDGLDNLSAPWLAGSAFFSLVTLLILITFIGEAIREAFDPKKFTTYQ